MASSVNRGSAPDFDYCPTLAAMLETNSTVGASGKAFSPLGVMSTRNNLAVLRNFMLRHKPARTLEVGLGYGASALALASGAELHTACDPYQHLWDNAGLAVVKKAGLGARFRFLNEASSLALPELLRRGERFGLVYVDGSHFFDDVFVDFYYAIRLLTDDGVVFLDDSSTDHVSKVASFVRANWRGWVAEVDVAEYRAVDWRYRVARRLGRTQLTAFRRTGKDSREWDAPLARF